MSDKKTSLETQSVHIKILEIQVKQLADMLLGMQHNSLPNTSKVNSSKEGKENYELITMSSEKELEEPEREELNSKKLDELVEKEKISTSLNLEEKLDMLVKKDKRSTFLESKERKNDVEETISRMAL